MTPIPYSILLDLQHESPEVLTAALSEMQTICKENGILFEELSRGTDARRYSLRDYIKRQAFRCEHVGAKLVDGTLRLEPCMLPAGQICSRPICALRAVQEVPG